MSPERAQRTAYGGQPQADRGAVRATDPTQGLPSRQVFWVPLAMAFGLLLVSLLPRVQENAVLTWSFWGAGAGLLGWQALLFVRLEDAAASRTFEIVLRRQHYVQAMLHTAIFTYWGLCWPQVFPHLPLLVGQLLFAYGFDMLLSWSRRDTYKLGFGPFPIIFSINLFLWFRDDWFYLQFLMIAVGFLGKEFVLWNRDGRRVHIFNPSAFSQGLFSIVLIATGTSDLTWGDQISTSLRLGPSPYLFLFGIGLLAMYYFSTTLVTAAAAAVIFGLSALYTELTGVPFFIDSEIPIAVFLGLHLLVTDPSTSPRTAPGKLIFGVLYGLGVFVLAELLAQFGVPAFYDKLLAVPLLNLSVQRIDRLARALPQTLLVGRDPGEAIPRRANLVHMAVWILFFGVMASHGAADGRHMGDSLPFWERACVEDRRNGCSNLTRIEGIYCKDGSGWACNEIGLRYMEGSIAVADPEFAAGWFFSRACALGFEPGCANQQLPRELQRGDPRTDDLRLLVREGGSNLFGMPEPLLYERACEHGWTFACPAEQR